MISKICGALVVLLLLAGVCLAAEKPITDDAVYNQVRIKLADDPVVKGGGLQVDVKQGVVTLSGTVELQVHIEKATKVAKKVKGVNEVINHLEIRNKSAGKRGARPEPVSPPLSSLSSLPRRISPISRSASSTRATASRKAPPGPKMATRS